MLQQYILDWWAQQTLCKRSKNGSYSLDTSFKSKKYMQCYHFSVVLPIVIFSQSQDSRYCRQSHKWIVFLIYLSLVIDQIFRWWYKKFKWRDVMPMSPLQLKVCINLSMQTKKKQRTENSMSDIQVFKNQEQ